MLGSNCGFDVLRHGGAQIFHMDIKSVNVLLQDKTCRVAKIADLGISKYLVKGSLLDYTYRGMEAYDCVFQHACLAVSVGASACPDMVSRFSCS